LNSSRPENAFDLSQFEVLTFDCYGTMIDWESGIFSALKPILAGHNKTLADSQLLELYSELEAEAEQGVFRPYRTVLQEVVNGVGQRLGFAPTEAEASSLPESLASWQPFADTVPALRKLKTKYKLGVISNVDDDLFAASARKLEVKFDHVITAQQAIAYKPSLTIFKLAQERIGIGPNRWLHVGQSIYHDLIPAKSLGISTVWVNRLSPRVGSGAAKAAEGQPDIEVPDLRTLSNMAS
jgi:2-haloacid dehalogenase